MVSRREDMGVADRGFKQERLTTPEDVSDHDETVHCQGGPFHCHEECNQKLIKFSILSQMVRHYIELYGNIFDAVAQTTGSMTRDDGLLV